MSTKIVRAKIAEFEVAELEATYSSQDRLSKRVAHFGSLMFASEERSTKPVAVVCCQQAEGLHWIAEPDTDRKGVTSFLSVSGRLPVSERFFF